MDAKRITAAITGTNKKKSGISSENKALRVDVSWTAFRPITRTISHQTNAIYPPIYGIRQNINAALEYADTLNVPVIPRLLPLRIKRQKLRTNVETSMNNNTRNGEMIM